MKRLLILFLFPLTTLAQQPPQPAPDITLSANDANSVSLYQGWPLLVDICIMNSLRGQGGSAASLVIAPASGNWTDAIQLTATSSSGTTFQWPFKLVGAAATPTLTLTANSYVIATWQIAVGDTATLPTDTYQLTATIEESGTSGWNGVAIAPAITIQVTPEPSLTPAQQQLKAFLTAQYQTNTGDLNSALMTIEQYLAANPSDLLAMEATANLLELQGYQGLAYLEAVNAVNAFSQVDPMPVEAPSNLLSMYQRLVTYMTTPPGSSAAPTVTSATSAAIPYSPANQNVTVSATVSSAGAPVNEGTVTFSIPGVGNPVTVTVVANTASAVFAVPGGTAVGSYPLVADFAGTSNFQASSDSEQLTITLAPLAITANNASRRYSQANPAFTASYGGLPPGSAAPALNGTLVCTTTATAASPAGTYPITCSGLSSPNYSITFVPGVLTVTADALTVAAPSTARQYGQPDPPLNNVNYSGFVNGDGPGSLSGVLSCTSSDTPLSPVGSYAINCSGLSSPNYVISYVPGTLVVTPAPLTIAATNATRSFGTNNPAFSGTIVGLLNSDAVSATFASPAATPASPVGNYAIVPTAIGAPAVLGNYALALVNGTLTVTPESTSLNVAVTPSSISVGQSATVTMTLTASGMVIPIDASLLAPLTATSTFSSDVLTNNGVCIPVPTVTPGQATCSLTVTSVEPNGHSINASFAGTADLVASTGAGDFMVTAAISGQPVCIASDFRNIAVAGGSAVWFNSIFKVHHVTRQLVHVSFFSSTAQFQYVNIHGGLVTVNESLPNAAITIDPSATVASTTFDPANNMWNTTLPWDLDDAGFLTGMPWTVPPGGLPGDVKPVTVCGTFASDVAGMEIGWRWAAAAYSSFGSNNSVLGVKPIDSDGDNPATNDDRAGTPENFKQFVIPGARGKGGRNYTGTYTHDNTVE
jgi:hypothetical protein